MKARAPASFVFAGLVSAGIYMGITLRLPWWRYGGSLRSWSSLLGENWAVFAACQAGVVALMLAYLWGWRAVRRGQVRRLVVWAFAGLFVLTLFWLLPITSDLFIYLGRAHLFTDLGGNPMYDVLLSRTADRLLRAYPAAYAQHASVYGPAWFLLSAPATVGPHDVAMGIAYLKGLSIASVAGCAWLLERIVRKVRPGHALEALYLFAWNPLVLFMAVGDGHNDMSMMVLVLVAAWLLLEERWAPAFIALSVAVWVKYVAGAFFPLFLIYAWKRLAADNRDSRTLWWQAGLPAATVTLLVFLPFGESEELATIGWRLLAPRNWSAGSGDLPMAVMVAGLLLFIAAYGFVVRRLVRGNGSYQQLANACFATALLAFVLGAARSQPWHLIWPAALASLSDHRWAWPAMVVFSGAMLATQVWVEWGTIGLGGL